MDVKLTAPGGGARTHHGPDPRAVADLAARFVVEAARDALASRGTFRVALAGGSTPRLTYERLAALDLISSVDWARVSVFFGDERMVPPEDPSSNYRMARDALLAHVPVPDRNVHRIEGELRADVAVARYSAVLGAEPLDLVLLGMGDDGHVASLFPGGPELESAARVLSSHAPVSPHERVTLGLGVLNAARQVGFLVTGISKAARVGQVFAEQRAGQPMLPAARVQPSSRALHWFLDDAAATAQDPVPAARDHTV